MLDTSGLNLCIRGDDNAHNPESPRGDRGNGPETSAKRSPNRIEMGGDQF